MFIFGEISEKNAIDSLDVSNSWCWKQLLATTKTQLTKTGDQES